MPAEHRDKNNDDVNMLQRAMIQLFYLDKGRLASFRIGQYDKGSDKGWYRSSHPDRNVKQWSSIADEVENYHKFAMNDVNEAATLKLTTVRAMWSEFDRILAAPLPVAVNQNSEQFNNWVAAAVANSGIAMPADLDKTEAEVLKAHIEQEDGGRHSNDRFAPLAVSNVRIGENTAGAGVNVHAFTDGGLGFGKVQPYNRGQLNLYKPDENLTRVAQIMKDNIDNAPGTTAVEKLWRALFKYNNGQYRGDTTFADLRNGVHARSATYADAIIQRLNLQIP